jgi:hypothetical protein
MNDIYRKQNASLKDNCPFEKQLTNINISYKYKRTKARTFIYVYIHISSSFMYVIVYEGPSEITGKYKIRIYCAKETGKKNFSLFQHFEKSIRINKYSLRHFLCKQDKMY